MSENLREKLWRYIAIRNSINLICFTILAIVFQKWWIIFFSCLFWAYEKEDYGKEDKE